jgi:hypothetical protein
MTRFSLMCTEQTRDPSMVVTAIIGSRLWNPSWTCHSPVLSLSAWSASMKSMFWLVSMTWDGGATLLSMMLTHT